MSSKRDEFAQELVADLVARILQIGLNMNTTPQYGSKPVS